MQSMLITAGFILAIQNISWENTRKPIQIFMHIQHLVLQMHCCGMPALLQAGQQFRLES